MFRQSGTIKRTYSYFSKEYMNNKYSVLKTAEPNDEQEENSLNSIYNICILKTRQQDGQLKAIHRCKRKVKTKHKTLQCILGLGTKFNRIYETKFIDSRNACWNHILMVCLSLCWRWIHQTELSCNKNFWFAAISLPTVFSSVVPKCWHSSKFE